MRAEEDIKDKKEEITRDGKKVTKSAIAELRRMGRDRVEVSPNDFEGAYALSDVVNTETGEVIVESNTEILAGKAAADHRGRRRKLRGFLPEKRHDRRSHLSDA